MKTAIEIYQNGDHFYILLSFCQLDLVPSFAHLLKFVRRNDASKAY